MATLVCHPSLAAAASGDASLLVANTCSAANTSAGLAAPAERRMRLFSKTYFGKELYIFECDAEKFLLGVQIATLLRRETYNLYRSLKIKNVVVQRATAEQLFFMITQGAVHTGTHSVTLVPLDDALYFLGDALQQPNGDWLNDISEQRRAQLLAAADRDALSGARSVSTRSTRALAHTLPSIATAPAGASAGAVTSAPLPNSPSVIASIAAIASEEHINDAAGQLKKKQRLISQSAPAWPLVAAAPAAAVSTTPTSSAEPVPGAVSSPHLSAAGSSVCGPPSPPHGSTASLHSPEPAPHRRKQRAPWRALPNTQNKNPRVPLHVTRSFDSFFDSQQILMLHPAATATDPQLQRQLVTAAQCQQMLLQQDDVVVAIRMPPV